MIYEYQCSTEGCKQPLIERESSVKDMKKWVKCPECKKKAERVLWAHPKHLSWSTWQV